MATPPSFIVIHTMVGSLASAEARFLNPDPNQRNGRASAHYLVGLDGAITQMVDEKDAAWHCGVYAQANYHDNLDSIGIEHEDNGDYNGPRTPALYTASAQLVHDIVHRYPQSLAFNRASILKHNEIVATGCPDALDVERIVREAAALDATPPPPPVPDWRAHMDAQPASFILLKPVAVVDMETGNPIASVPAGPLAVAYETTTKGVDYWVTLYSVQKNLAHGLRKLEVAAAAQPPPDPRDVKIAQLTADWQELWRATVKLSLDFSADMATINAIVHRNTQQ
jgi:hypothetical protein